MSRSFIAATRTRCARLSQNSSAQRLDETLILRRVVRLMLLRGPQCVIFAGMWREIFSAIWRNRSVA